MENILQSLVKIIIIGVLHETCVDCNRQFLVSPPLPYYQNENYYVPGFAPVYQEPLPVYYPERSAPPPVSYQNINSYTPPQLFYQNENYIPPTSANPGLRYPLPPVAPHKQSFQQQYKTQSTQYKTQSTQYKTQSKPNTFSRVSYSKPLQPQRTPEVPQKKPEAFASNIIIKEEPLSPYYQDDYGKNYNDDDYSENYTDESPTPTKPCLTSSPYRYFEARKDIPNSADKYTLCNPYFQPNFGNSVYTVKMPITLLPSRFPPRVEQLIERIQNYFSTYTQQQTQQKPQNETLQPSSTPQTTSESIPVLSTTEEVYKKNKTSENEQETTTQSANDGDVEQLTEEFVLEIEAKEPETLSSTVVPDALEKKEEVQTTQRVEETTTTTTESVSEAGGLLQSTEAAISEGGQPVGGAETGNEVPVEVRESSTVPEEVTMAMQANNDQTTGTYDDVTSTNG